jgi:hypothetical protein
VTAVAASPATDDVVAAVTLAARREGAGEDRGRTLRT